MKRYFFLLTAFLFISSPMFSAQLLRHWSLDEASLNYDGGKWSGTEEDISKTAGRLFGFAEFSDIGQSGAGLIGNKGAPGSNDLAYDFQTDPSIGGVATQVYGALPETGDFTLEVWIKTSSPHTSQGHIFSNSSNQPGRASLYIQNGKASFWADGFSSALSSVSNVDDGQWHKVSAARSGENFYLKIDERLEAWSEEKGIIFDQNTFWMIGRQRSWAGNYEGMVSDVKVYDEALFGSPQQIEYSTPENGFQFADPSAAALSWEAPKGVDVMEYRVYFSEDFQAVSDLSSDEALADTIPAGQERTYSPEGLEFNTTYYWRIDAETSGGEAVQGRISSFRTEPLDIPGQVIAHSPKSSGIYIGSPAIAILPSGEYVVKFCEFGPGSTFDTSLIYISSDKGKNWKLVNRYKGMFWSNLFLHNSELYQMGASKRYGQCVIRKSSDGGRTWTTPQDENSGIILPDSQYHTAAVPMVVSNGRIWRAMEDGQNGTKWGERFRAFVMSAPLDSNLLKASSWTATNRIAYNENWLGGEFGGFLEGNAVLTPDGQVVNILRVDYRDVPEKAAIIRVSEDGETASFDPENDFITFPGGCKKFTIRRDPVTNRCWTLSNAVLPQHEGGNVERTRNAQVLMSSENLREWTEHKVVLYHEDVSNHGFQYLDWRFEGDDIVAASRTAYDDGLGGADNQHNSNFITFHRFEDFRGPHRPYIKSQPEDSLQTPAGRDISFEITVNNGADSFTWYKKNSNGSDLKISAGGRFSLESGSGSSQLTIESISNEDEGEYYCVAENSAGQVRSEPAKLTIDKQACTAASLMKLNLQRQSGFWSGVIDSAYQSFAHFSGFSENDELTHSGLIVLGRTR
ncbi:LamG-like jellyroll fold domain-containing protein [Sedimentisphaera salicampi]|uniref:Immunoglobulin I-set domain protein n=1 Tax=Sedimentisphaera salicampi TaxID=1941349 RepID=A0A1W6LMU7_9BACT|nr:LamG-like jellyroll fold domain-containing protein [Sedimentisphaera salicampi]ARN57099.1 putative protein related to plant photosystem II stability/assembly factor [Sedimentisphaera salicampi]